MFNVNIERLSSYKIGSGELFSRILFLEPFIFWVFYFCTNTTVGLNIVKLNISIILLVLKYLFFSAGKNLDNFIVLTSNFLLKN